MICGCQYCAMWLYMYGIGSMVCTRCGCDGVGCGHMCGQGCAYLSVLLDLWGEDDLECMLLAQETEVGKEAAWLWQFPLVPLSRGSVAAVSTSMKGGKKDCARQRRKVLSPGLFICTYRKAEAIEDSGSADLRSVRQDD